MVDDDVYLGGIMEFTKMQGCGNDYVYVNGFENKIDNPNKLSEIVSDRHFGIGSDGLIVINPSEKADFKMSMYNADGSEGKMCGNGIRCVAKYVYDNKMTDKTTITVETLSGIKTLELNVKNDKVETVKVNMGTPILLPKDVPVVSDKDKVVDEPIVIDDKEYRITCVSMGNPHAITFIENTDDLEIETIGPKFENNPIFPDRVNTEFIQVLDRNTVKMRVWERGSGETFACGTGACATVVACVLNGLTDDKVTVKLLGGDLFIEYNREENTVYMTGPAKVSFTGKIEV
jgi:diaminopimelate epimerase